MTATIDIYGPTSILKGDFDLDAVRAATSWRVEGAEYSKAYRRGAWDGRKHLFHAKTGAFPTGLVKVVEGVLHATSVAYVTADHREDPYSGEPEEDQDNPQGLQHQKVGTFAIQGAPFVGRYSYQLDAARDMVAAKQGIVRIATNGGKTEIACGVTNYLDIRTLFIVTSKELLYQARARFATRLGLPLEEIGIIGDGHWQPGEWVTISTLDTLESRLDTPECQSFLKKQELLFIDECHHVGSETWYTVATLCGAYYRFGLSGTPLDRTDGANLRLRAATGDVIVDIGNEFLVNLGVSAKAHIVFDKVSSPQIKKGSRYNTVYKQGVVENDEMTAKVIQWTQLCHAQGLSVLILIDEIPHGRSLDEKLWTDTDDGVFIPHQFIYGEESTEVRADALREFGERKLPVLIASTILDEGVDVPTIDVVICAGSRKSKIRTLQRLGRGLRGDRLIVIEFSNFCHQYLLEHSLQRYRDYKAEKCFPLFQSSPDEGLIKKLWEAQA